MDREKRADIFCTRARREQHQAGRERGFTLLETTIALLIMMIVGLGAASLFAFAVSNNSGGNDRAQTLALAQQALERLRNATFTLTQTDSILAAGTITQTVVRGGPDPDTSPGRVYTVESNIVNTTPTLKTITVTVTPQLSNRTWNATSGGSVTIITQRSRSE